MAGRRRPLVALGVVVLLALAMVGCAGGGDEPAGPSQTSDGSGAARGGTEETGSAEDGSGDPGGDRTEDGEDPDDDDGPAGSEGSRPDGGSGASGSDGNEEFVVPGGDNSVQEFGSEAGASERAQASRELQKYLRARAAGDQSAACAALSATGKSQLAELAEAVPGVSETDSCAAIFAAIDKSTPPSARANTMNGPIGSLRIEGDRAFALYHGADDADYTIQMEREGGIWKVAALVPFAL